MASTTNMVSAEILLGIIERLERVREDKKAASNDESLILAEAKANGFHAKAIKAVLKIRAMKPNDRQENEAILDTYLHSLGMAPEPPLFRAMGLLGGDSLTREGTIERLKSLAPATGDIIVRAGGAPVRIFRDTEGEPCVEDWREPEAPAPREKRSDTKPSDKGEVPEVDEDGALDIGKQFARDNRAIIENPFPYGDARRAKFDEGWRRENGGDGMGPQ